MQKISVLVVAGNEERRIGRLLETLRIADEIVLVDHGSADATLSIARQYGAKIVRTFESAMTECAHDWILVLRPEEGIHESLEASILEWKLGEPVAMAYSAAILDELSKEKEHPSEVRLAHRHKAAWSGPVPVSGQPHLPLSGLIVRYAD